MGVTTCDERCLGVVVAVLPWLVGWFCLDFEFDGLCLTWCLGVEVAAGLVLLLLFVAALLVEEAFAPSILGRLKKLLDGALLFFLEG